MSGGARRRERIDATFDASRHVVLPGLVNTHHHFYQTLTRAHPSAINKPLFPWLVALYPIWARLKPDAPAARRAARADRAHAVGLHHRRRPSLSLSGGPRERGRHRGRGGARARHAHDRLARLDEPVGEGRRPAARQRRAGRRDDPRRQRAGAEAVPRSEAGRANSRRARALFAVLDLQGSDERKREACRALRLPASHASLRDRGRRAVLP